MLIISDFKVNGSVDNLTKDQVYFTEEMNGYNSETNLSDFITVSGDSSSYRYCR